MFKFLLILAIIVFLLYKIGSFIFRVGAASQHFRNFQQQQQPGKRAADNRPRSEEKKASNFKGGEYIDYEEVK